VARTSNSKPIVCKLNCGGTIKFFPGICSAGQIRNLKEEMEEVSVFKQYKVRDCVKEPRVHALFASNGGGYQYGNVKMGSNPLDPIPFITKVGARLAAKFELPSKEWNIGYHLVMFCNGKDSINWHADDTQGEDVVLSLTVDGPEDPRTICFQPANTMDLQDGDEQIEVYTQSEVQFETSCQIGKKTDQQIYFHLHPVLSFSF
jgi:hypothetical protein